MTSFSHRIQAAKDLLAEKTSLRILLIPGTILLLVAWWLLTPSGLLGKADAIGYAVCHRIDTRSFHMGERQLGVCSRCTGQYLGAMIGLVFLSLRRPRRTRMPQWAIISILGIFALAYAVDGLNSYLHFVPQLSRFYLYEPSNTLRLITGTGLGLGISVMLYPAYNDSVWKKRDSRPVLNGFGDFIVLLGICMLLDLLILSENPLILYPVALISSGGVLVLLTIVYSMVVMIVFKVENTFESISQLVYPLITGFIMALIQVSIMDTLRYLITGSWGGFNFG